MNQNNDIIPSAKTKSINKSKSETNNNNLNNNQNNDITTFAKETSETKSLETKQSSKTNRSGIAPFKGFYYQHYYTIKLFLENIDNDSEYIIEEGFEDIDIIKNNQKRIIYQIKYHDSKNYESLTYGSGLFKVIKAQWNLDRNTQIDEIHYISYGSFTKIKDHFENKKYEFIAKLFIFVHYHKIKKDIEFSVETNPEELIEWFENNKNNIQTTINDKELFDFFTNENNFVSYFAKFKLKQSDNFKKLEEDINEKICSIFNDFYIGDQTNEYSDLKTDFIRNKIDEIIRNNVIDRTNNSNDNDAKIKISDFMNKIREMKQIFSNKDDLFKEFLNSILTPIKNNDQLYNQTNYEEVLQRIKKLTNIDNIDDNNKFEIINKLADFIDCNDLNYCYDIRKLLVKYIYDTFKLKKLDNDIFIEMINHMSYIIRKLKNKNEEKDDEEDENKDEKENKKKRRFKKIGMNDKKYINLLKNES